MRHSATGSSFSYDEAFDLRFAKRCIIAGITTMVCCKHWPLASLETPHYGVSDKLLNYIENTMFKEKELYIQS